MDQLEYFVQKPKLTQTNLLDEILLCQNKYEEQQLDLQDIKVMV